jgi:hypothetical protein
MVDPEDLLSKADALMARQRLGRTTAEPYAEFPVLDEVVDLPPESVDFPALTEPEVPAPLNEEQVQALAASIRTSLLAALQPEIDTLIDERLKEGLAPLVERIFDDLRRDLELIAREILSDAINIAVEQERERRKSDG